MKHNGTRLMKILIFYSLILHVNAGILHHSLFFYSLGHIGKLSGNFTNRVFRLIAHASYHLRLASLVFKIPDLITSHCIKCERGFVLDALPRSSFTKKLATSSRWSGRLGPQWATMNSMQSSVDSRSNSFFGSVGGA